MGVGTQVKTKSAPAKGTAPEAGKLVSVRNRPALVKDASQKRSNGDVLTLVEVEYLDGSAHPPSDRVLWELEPTAQTLENAGWPDFSSNPDRSDLYDAYVDSVRWTSLQSVQSILKRDGKMPVVSPWSAAVQIEDYQIQPLLKALSMPRVSLLLADDVGLGKTIQAGLIATELILRRRIKRILVVCPASLQVQWQEELKEKFHLDFEIMDADGVRRTQRELGSDMNPWSVRSRIITSMDYLRQELIYQQFESSAKKRQEESSGAFAPWDLLIVDEAHNVAPKSMTDESQRARMMRRLTQWFEHRLFLTATPHNGYTPSFTGLLELLDPFRFVQASILTPSDRNHVRTVMVRRLKSEINDASSLQRFPEREVIGVPVKLHPSERALYDALRQYREDARKALQGTNERAQNRGRFIFSLLTKRLLSSPYAFARTWWRHVGRLAEEEDKEGVGESEVDRAIQVAEEDTADDLERDDRERHAIAQAGSWLLMEAPRLKDPAESVSEALREYGWSEERTKEGPKAGLDLPDAKFDTLLKHIKKGLKVEGAEQPPLVGPPSRLLEDERLILFTEYKDTLQYLESRLEKSGYKHPVLRTVYGGMGRTERDDVKSAFNDASAQIRILLATDAASEGLNLQRECRYVAHYEIPWNPMRLEQRNGRVDRHGQGRDVRVYHYASDDDADQSFLTFVARKVHEARHDVGSVNDVIDDAVQQHFWGNVDQKDLNEWVQKAQVNDPARQDLEDREIPKEADFRLAHEQFRRASTEYQLSTTRIENVVRNYFETHHARLETGKDGHRVTNARGRLKLFLQRHLAGQAEAMPRLVFDPESYIETINGRPIFRPKPGTRLVRLGHPVTDAALAYFRRALWGQEPDIKRWTIRAHHDAGNPEAYLELQYLLTARNALQEVVETRVGSWWFHITKKGLRHLDEPPSIGKVKQAPRDAISSWQAQLRPHTVGLNETTRPLREALIESTRVKLDSLLEEAKRDDKKEMQVLLERRIKEIEKESADERRRRLQEELIRAEEQAAQRTFNEAENKKRQKKAAELRQALSEEDFRVYDANLEQLKERLKREHERYKNHVLPKRFKLGDDIELVEVGAVAYVPSAGGR